MNRIFSRFSGRAWKIPALLAAVAVVTGCAESQRPVATGKGAVRGINAIVTSPELFFLNEERSSGSVNYRGVAGFTEWDDLEYNFNFDVLLPGATERDRIASQFVDVVADTEYTLVLTGTLDNPTIIMWEGPVRDLSESDAFFDIDFAHMSPQLGQVDVYYAPDGTAPAVGMEVASMAFGERIPYVEFQPGDYVVTLTAPGDPSTVLFESEAFERVGGERLTLMISDPDPSITSPAGVDLINASGATQRLSDVDSPPLVRLLHVAFGTENFDGYLDENLANVVYPDLGFEALSAYAEAADVVTPLTLTPVGDNGTSLFTADIQRITGSLRTIAVFGDVGNLAVRPLNDEARPLSTYPVVRISHLATNLADGLDIYEVDPGTALTDEVFPQFPGQILGLTTGFYAAGTGMREFVLTLPGEKTPVGTPLVLDLATGDIADVAIVDTADPAVPALLVFDSNL